VNINAAAMAFLCELIRRAVVPVLLPSVVVKSGKGSGGIAMGPTRGGSKYSTTNEGREEGGDDDDDDDGEAGDDGHQHHDHRRAAAPGGSRSSSRVVVGHGLRPLLLRLLSTPISPLAVHILQSLLLLVFFFFQFPDKAYFYFVTACLATVIISLVVRYIYLKRR